MGLASRWLESKGVAVCGVMFPAIRLGEIDEFFVLTGIGFEDQVVHRCGFGVFR